MKAALTGAGFKVMAVQDAALPGFGESAVPEFLAEIRPGDVCLFYYSGYAVQTEEDNFMLPVNFDPATKSRILGRAYPFGRLAQELEDRKAGLTIFMIEASRHLDLVSGITGPGLKSPDADIKELLFTSAGPANQIVPDAPNGGPGWFTRSLAGNIAKVPGISLDEIVRRMRADVEARTGEIPDVRDTVTRPFFFHPPEQNVTIFQNHRDRLDYALIHAGEFQMGCVPGDHRCQKHEMPRHSVTISKDFWMATTEVDVTAYERYVEENRRGSAKPKMPPAPNFNKGWKATSEPIVNVSWEDADSYCNWAGGRLPTEAEWEYCARAGKENEIYPLNSENSRDKANFYGKQGNDIFDWTAPVKSFDANAFHLYDMAGNVWEWMSDWYSPDYYAVSPAVDPRGPSGGKLMWRAAVRSIAMPRSISACLFVTIRRKRKTSLGFGVYWRTPS